VMRSYRIGDIVTFWVDKTYWHQVKHINPTSVTVVLVQTHSNNDFVTYYDQPRYIMVMSFAGPVWLPVPR
jgi:hypothetical protein